MSELATSDAKRPARVILLTAGLLPWCGGPSAKQQSRFRASVESRDYAVSGRKIASRNQEVHPRNRCRTLRGVRRCGQAERRAGFACPPKPSESLSLRNTIWTGSAPAPPKVSIGNHEARRCYR